MIQSSDVSFSPWLRAGAYNSLLQISEHSMHPITAYCISPAAKTKLSATIQINKNSTITFKTTNKLFEYLLISKALNKSRLLGHSSDFI